MQTRQCARDAVAFLAHETLHFIGPKLWPQTLNPDYKVSGHMQGKMCHTPVRDMVDLKQRLIDMWSGLSVIDGAINHVLQIPQGM